MEETNPNLTDLYFPDCNMGEFINNGAEYADDPEEERLQKIRDTIADIYRELDNLNGMCSELMKLVYDKQDRRAVDLVKRHITDAMYILEDIQ